MGDKCWTRQGLRHCYNTKSHRIHGVYTPGGKLVGQRIAKRTNGPKCSDCQTSLPGTQHMRSSVFARSKQRERTVSRCYGGSACANSKKTRIMRAF
jgi:large subunit ribosomal protein L34e